MDFLTGGKQTPWENSSIRQVFYFTEDTLSQSPIVAANIPPTISTSLGRLLNIPVAVPVLNETGRQISLASKTASYFVENGIGLEMAQIRGGKFLMGTNAADIEKAYGDARKTADELTQETVAAEMP